MKKNIDENITFEKAIEELEYIIKSLEQGDVPLDNTIELYERGAKLKDFCEKKLFRFSHRTIQSFKIRNSNHG